MKTIAIIIILFTGVCATAQTPVNYVMNPSFEQHSKCPDAFDQLTYATYWSDAVDTVGTPTYAPEYYNTCAGSNPFGGIPVNGSFYQYAHSGNGMAGGGWYYDKSLPYPSIAPKDYRDYIQGHLVKSLTAGKTYCVSFWVNLAESAGYAINKLGAYLDDGNINHTASAGSEITFITPQVYTDSIIIDTANWTKIEGSFVAIGNETHITIGDFFTNAMTRTVVTNYWATYPQYSYYLLDDVSVIPIDLDVQAGVDTWVEVSKSVQIGRVGDSTATGLDCKWYHKGALIDSGAIITVNAAATKGIVDTYVVVQTICGNVTIDTVLVTTVGLGMTNVALQNSFMVYPNPSDGNVFIKASDEANGNITVKVFDLLGRVVLQQPITFSDHQSAMKINAPSGTYILELQDKDGSNYKERITIH